MRRLLGNGRAGARSRPGRSRSAISVRAMPESRDEAVSLLTPQLGTDQHKPTTRDYIPECSLDPSFQRPTAMRRGTTSPSVLCATHLGGGTRGSGLCGNPRLLTAVVLGSSALDSYVLSLGKMEMILSFILIATTLMMGRESWALENCSQEQARLRAQVHQLEIRVKQQQVTIAQLLHEREVQFLDKGEENSVIDLGGKRQYADCSEIFNDGYKRSGFYKIKPLQSPAEFPVYCDMSDGGGWTVIQRRSDGSENFNRGWNDYENGFGNFVQRNGEYWLGNKNLHLLTTQGDYTLKINLEDFEKNSRYAQYKSFKVGDEKNSYDLHIGDYSGTAGDSLSGTFHPEVQWWASHQRMKFSTWDRDNDNYKGNCAEEDQSGWWFNRCHSANLNGVYYSGPYTAETDNGVVWYTWRGWWYSLKSVVMKIRPNDFIPNII